MLELLYLGSYGCLIAGTLCCLVKSIHLYSLYKVATLRFSIILQDLLFIFINWLILVVCFVLKFIITAQVISIPSAVVHIHRISMHRKRTHVLAL